MEARTAAGREVASDTFTVEKGSHGFLWMPVPDPTIHFLLQTTEYGGSNGGTYTEPFETSGRLQAFPRMVTQWFRDNPKSVVVQKWATSDIERALRRVK